MTTPTALILGDFNSSREHLIQIGFLENVVCHVGILNWKILILK